MTGPIEGGLRFAEGYTKLSRRTLGRLLPEIEHIRVGGRILFTKQGLDAFLARHTVKPKPARKTADVEKIVRNIRRRAR